ncbi:MAG: response regulator transcription factor [Elusimicrobia bacterium]|nr:response regulator transcription factor [Elusimicrobiota bacterium]
MNRRVLVVDDEREQRCLLRRLLEKNGLEVTSAASTREALEIVRDAAARPAVILSDIAMPGLDGVALVKALQASSETAAIPAILMTGRAIPNGILETAAEALGLGPVFLKGAGFESLLPRVAALLRPPAARKRSIVVDPLKRAVWIDEHRLSELPARRFQLFCTLLHARRAMSREELLDRIWDGNDNLNTVDVTVMRLRQDLKDLAFLRVDAVPAGYHLIIDDRPSRPD